MNYHFLFDYDGVLIQKWDYAQVMADKYGIEVQKIRQFFSQYLQKCLRGEIDMLEVLEKHLPEFGWAGTTRSFFEALYLEEVSPNVELIRFIREKLLGHFLCHIATNQDYHRYTAIAQSSLAKELFAHVFSSSELGIAKPSVGYFSKMYIHLQEHHPGISKKQIIFVDDLKENVASARQFGFESHVYQTQDAFENFVIRLIPNVAT